MKTIKQYLIGITILLLFLIAPSSFAQDDLPYVGVTNMYWNLDLEDFSMDEWREVEKEFHEKVTMKNEHILSTTTLLHHFTTNSSEIINVTVYASWSAIEEATNRNNKLIEEAWPNEDDRKAFLKKQGQFYANEHSDEIYRAFPGAKAIEAVEDVPLIYYVRTSYFSFPEEGTNEEFMSLFNEFNEAATYKNEHYKAYYPQVHFYGADRSEFVEVFITENLAQLEKGLARQGELFREYMPDETKRDDYGKKYGKYFNGVHSDRIFSSVPELYKAMPQSDD